MLKNNKSTQDTTSNHRAEEARQEPQEKAPSTPLEKEQLEKDIKNSKTIASEELTPEEKLKMELAHWNDKYVRLYAEFDNFKRRTLKERIEIVQTANKDVIVSLLPILDDFDRAIKSIEATHNIEALKEGVSLINHKLKNLLVQKGLKEMECKGQAFNADLHEGITTLPTEDESLKGKILDELEKGYFLNDKVIRFARVVVGE